MREVVRPSIIEIRYDYISIQPNGDIQLSVPCSMGFEVGTDNTCQSASEIRKFFRRDGATASLLKLQHDIQHQLLLHQLSSDEARVLHKQLSQIDTYLALIRSLTRDVGSIQRLLQAYPHFPEGMTKAFGDDKQNIIAILLSPAYKDDFLRYKKYRCRMTRSSHVSAPCFADNLLDFLDTFSFFSTEAYVVPQHKSACDLVLEKVCKELSDQGRTELATTPENVNVVMKLIYREAMIQEPQPDALREQMKTIATALCYDDADEREECKTFVKEVFLGMGLVLEEPEQSIFMNSIRKINLGGSTQLDDVAHLAIQIQLYLVIVALYAKENGMCERGQDIINYVEQVDYNNLHLIFIEPILQGTEIEGSVLEHIQKSSCMSREFTSEDQAAIKKLYLRIYEQIKEAPHFDEFIILRSDSEGDFYTYQGRICFDFVRFCNYQLEAMGVSLVSSARTRITDFLKKLPAMSAKPEPSEIERQNIIKDSTMEVLAQNIRALQPNDVIENLMYMVSYLDDAHLVELLLPKLDGVQLQIDLPRFRELLDQNNKYIVALINHLVVPLIKKFDHYHLFHFNYQDWNYWGLLVSQVNYNSIISNFDELVNILKTLERYPHCVSRVFSTINHKEIIGDNIVGFFKKLPPRLHHAVAHAIDDIETYFESHDQLKALEMYLPESVFITIYNAIPVIRHRSSHDRVKLFGLRDRSTLKRPSADDSTHDDKRPRK